MPAFNLKSFLEKEGVFVRSIVQVCNFGLQKNISTGNVTIALMQHASRQAKYEAKYTVMIFLPSYAFI